MSTAAGAAAVLVSAKPTEPPPVTAAVTVYAPALALAVAAALATPLALVTAAAIVADAPEPGAVKLTVAPGTGLPWLSLTVADSDCANAVRTVADWALPPVWSARSRPR